MNPPFVPDRGDIVWLALDPQAGHEQAGRRPALVLSPAPYNEASGLALLCPVTTRKKGYPFEVELPGDGAVHGVVLADQVESLDWRVRGASLIERAPGRVTAEVIGKVAVLLG